MRFHLLINMQAGTVAGADDGVLESEIRKQFQIHGVEIEIERVDSSQLSDAARRAALDSASVVVAVGGDGTINAIAHELIGTGKALGIIPLGTFNLFARDFGIPLTLPDAVRTIVEGEETRINTATLNDVRFVLFSAIGLYPLAVQQREEIGYTNRFGKYWAMLRGMAATLSHYPMRSLKLTTETNSFTVRTPLVVVGPAPFRFNHGIVGRDRTKEDGTLTIAIGTPVSRRTMCWLAAKELLGIRPDHDGLEFLTGNSFCIESQRRATLVTVDGEIMKLAFPLVYAIKPKSLTVIVPRTVVRDIRDDDEEKDAH